VTSLIANKVKEGLVELELLTTYKVTHLHAAHSALTHGLSSKMSYLSRTTPGIRKPIKPLEDSIWSKLIPAITNISLTSHSKIALLSLPSCLGGIALSNPVTASLTAAILLQNTDFTIDVSAKITAKQEMHTHNRVVSYAAASRLKETLSSSLSKSPDACLWKECIQASHHANWWTRVCPS